MKNAFLLIVVMFIAITVNSQDCVNCENTTTSGENPSAIGTDTKAEGNSAFAAGFASEAIGFYTTALGFYSFATYTGAISIGHTVKASAHKAITLGVGGPWNENIFLDNNMPRSLMIGFSSSNPTFYVSESSTSTGLFNKTGRIAIGNVTNAEGFMDPQAKLHIRSDDGEIAALLVEPNNWSAGEYAKLIVGDTSHYIKAENTNGLTFNSQNNFIFSGNNTGFGISEPKAKVHINGDLLFEQSMHGIIMKSEDGNCWKGTISNTGELLFTQIDCGTLTSTQNSPEQNHAEIFIYPNPSNGEITIEYTGNRKNLRAEFHTINGLLFATHKISKGENRIKLTDIPSQMITTTVYANNGELISTNKILIKK